MSHMHMSDLMIVYFEISVNLSSILQSFKSEKKDKIYLIIPK